MARKPSFYVYLKGQRKREDPVGDLARDVYADTAWPQRARRFEEVQQHLEYMDACDGAYEAANRAWYEFEQGARL